MPTTAEYLARLVQAKTDIATAITNKGGTVNSGDGLEEFPADIATIPTGSSEVEEKDVNFYDYDGTCVYSYTAQEFLALTEMPANPDLSSQGLTAQGWNWNLTDAKDYVQDFGMLDVGQLAVTSDGKTRITILADSTNYSIALFLGNTSDVSANIDWGDGSATETYTANIQHTYTKPNYYTITVEVVSGSITLSGAYSGHSETSGSYNPRSYFVNNGNKTNAGALAHRVLELQLGNNVMLSTCALAGLNCSKVNIPSTATFYQGQTSPGFAWISPTNRNTIKCIVLPNTVTAISHYLMGVSDYSSARYNEKYIICIPNSVTRIGDTTSVTSNTIYKYIGINSVIVPKTTTALPNSWAGMRFTKVSIPSTITLYGGQGSVDTTGNINMNGTYVSKISVKSDFPYLILCNKSYITELPPIPQTFTTLPQYSEMYNLKSITIPSNIIELSQYLTYINYELEYIKFESTTPPTVTNATVFTTMLASCKIYVPTGTLTDYTTAANYPDPTVYTYIEY